MIDGSLLLFKLALTPTLIALASLAGRRWGPAFSGWLVGLPLTSGPVAVFLVLAQGAPFAHTAATNTMLGAATEGAFCLAYGYSAMRWGWPVALGLAIASFGVATGLARFLAWPELVLYGLTLTSLIVALKLMPQAHPGGLGPGVDAVRPSRWDIPARMVIATCYVLLLTGFATRLGPQLTGLLSPFPLYGAILTVFAHAQRGQAAAVRVLRGLLFGLFGFASFFLVEALLIEHTPMVVAFAAAICATLGVHGLTLGLMRRSARRAL